MKKVPTKKKDQQPSEINGLKVQLARTLADYDNLRKRVEAEKGVWFGVASAKIVAKILPILDNLENMQKHLKDQGLAITIGEFKKIINEEGFTEIVPKPGEKFDENIMEAIEAIDGKEIGAVAETSLPGWKSEREVLRHAKVKVYK